MERGKRSEGRSQRCHLSPQRGECLNLQASSVDIRQLPEKVALMDQRMHEGYRTEVFTALPPLSQPDIPMAALNPIFDVMKRGIELTLWTHTTHEDSWKSDTHHV